ncbi:MAG: hypothetical protein C4334_05670 [Pyrinomonas sp.]|uniref:type II secretion system protein GspG n=1 Tax=Pyrinomonas sp. TaxID=2080306 RepID=UPI00332D7841
MNKKAFLCAALLCLFTIGIIVARLAPRLSEGEARRLIAQVAFFNLKTDDVKVRSISVLGGAAVVEAEIRTAFQFVQEGGRWRVAEMRVGRGEWERIDLLERAVNEEKRKVARAELELLAGALRDFRRDNGFYVISNDHAVLVDHLSPRYLARVIRLDPWHRPYIYRGTRDAFELRSAGEDGRTGTADDIISRSP